MLEKGKDDGAESKAASLYEAGEHEEEAKEETALNQFPCTRCEKAYKNISSLTRHMVEKHGFVKIPKGKRRRGAGGVLKGAAEPSPKVARLHEVIHDVDNEEDTGDDVIEDSLACRFCGESVFLGPDYQVHLTVAHKLTRIQVEQ